ncbi:glycoside hydrolase family 3 C-terminal domain-containing protein [candidate division KSB1 bacterium]|nr:glycoside hydrolase family 3 C-terminal domain-containing protein [candidate division KSB1 bacterium]
MVPSSRITISLIIILLSFCLAQPVLAQTPKVTSSSEMSYLNHSLPIDVRVNDLVSRMSLEEKVGQMVNSAPAIERLQIPAYNWWNECLHGVARAGLATVFPQAIGLAAMWNEDFMNDIATVISTEARAKHHDFLRKGERGIYKGLTFWSPNINIFRDPRWGRGMETYGEDPFLTGRMGVAFVKGLQGNDPQYLKVVATPKHYAVHSGPEPDRHHFDARISERDLRETYLPAFRACIIEANAYSVMGAYNRYMGIPCCAHEELLTKILRDEWGFKGYVVSDCGAIADIFQHHGYTATGPEAAAVAVKAGCELNCGHIYPMLVEAVQKGHINEKGIDVAVKRLFDARFRLGMFDPPENVPYAQIKYEMNDAEPHQKMALRAAHESITLLKNQNNFLPLKKNLKAIAVIGPNAIATDIMYGNYNGFPSKVVSPLDGIRAKVTPQTTVYYESGCNHTDAAGIFNSIPARCLKPLNAQPNQKGLTGEYFKNRELTGNPVLTRIDSMIYFTRVERLAIPETGHTNFSARWQGKLIPEVSGNYTLAITGDDGFRLYFEDRLVIDAWQKQGSNTEKYEVKLNANQEYKVKLEYYQARGRAAIQFDWSRADIDPIELAVAAAKKSEVVIMFGGLSPRLEGEEMKVEVEGFSGGDRTDIRLPRIQEELLKRLHATGKPVVLVLLNGSALAINWAEANLSAIIEAWYPGQAGGTAIADVIFGDYNPAGRLPVTFYASVDQLPPFDDYNMKNRTYRYFTGEPLYVFGHGLSYTNFDYLNLSAPKVVKTKENLNIRVKIKNSGKFDGDEVVQLYIKHKDSKLPQPIKSLKGFKRIHFKKGETKNIEIPLKFDELAYWDEVDKKYKVEAGKYEIQIGASSKDIRLIQEIEVVE